MKTLLPAAIVLASALVAPLAHAQCPVTADNCAPPTNVGTAIFDLAKSGPAPVALPTTPTLYSTEFTATGASTTLNIAFRNDLGYFEFGEASLTRAPGGTNLLTNGNFASGDLSGWMAANPSQAMNAGIVTQDGTFCPPGMAHCWLDGSTSAYDVLSQTVATVAGDTYTLSFELASNDAGTAEPVSATGHCHDGTAADVVAYAQGAQVPEPAALGLFALGLLVVGVRRREA